MVEDAGNHDLIPGYLVKNAMALVDDAANFQAIVWPRFAQQWEIRKLAEDAGYPALVSLSQILTETLHAERIDFDQIETRVPGKPDFSHAGRDARQ